MSKINLYFAPSAGSACKHSLSCDLTDKYEIQVAEFRRLEFEFCERCEKFQNGVLKYRVPAEGINWKVNQLCKRILDPKNPQFHDPMQGSIEILDLENFDEISTIL